MLPLSCLTYVFLIFFLKLDQPESIIQGVGDKEVDDKGQKPFPKKSTRCHGRYLHKVKEDI